MENGKAEALNRIRKAKTDKLETLELRGLRLREVPKEIGKLVDLKFLDLSHNDLTELPSEIGNLTNLNTLYLFENKLTNLPEEVMNLEKLSSFDLASNPWANLASLILELARSLPNVTTLYLENSDLTSLPDEIGYFTQLTVLNLEQNSLDTLPKEIGNLIRLEKLNLQENLLTYLPKEIGNLTQLTELDLRFNQLTNLPNEFGNLTRLESLDLQSNSLVSLPKSIDQFGHITKLELQFNHLEQLPIEIGKLNSLTELNIENNQLRSLPKELGELKELQVLKLNDNQFIGLPGGIEILPKLTLLDLGGNKLNNLPELLLRIAKSCPNLKALYLDENRIKSLPQEIGELKQLKSLFLNDNELSKLPKEIGNLTELITIDLGSNKLNSLPKDIGNLTNLAKLDLNSNKLNGLPKEIGNLTSLITLRLKSNNLSSFPKEIGNLTILSTLLLSSNNLNSLPKEICNLTALSTLQLDSNNLGNLPKEIGKLTELTELNLSSNKLDSLPKEIGKLTALSTLQLDSNNLNSLPKEIGKLTALSTLQLDSNNLNSLPKEIGKLTELTELNLSSNKLDSLPKEIGKLTELTELDLTDNQYKLGSEVFSLPPLEQIHEIMKWQEALVAGNLQPIHEAKVIFIGESNYGKTHLIEFLQKGKIKRTITTTHGIERSQFEVPYEEKPIRLNIWDLGGQEFMRSTHQFFFSERTLYVLVTLARKERNELNHWLKLASQLGNKAPVLIVINKIDLDPHDLDRKSLQRDYPNIIGFVRTCIKDKDENKAEETIKNLKKAIKDIVCNQELMPSIFEKRRPEWFTVKEQLEKLEEKGVDFISYDEYEKLDHIKSLPGHERKSNLKLLSMLGAVVSFVDDPRLMDTNVINPQWIMDGVYAIINDPIIKDDNKGRFELKDLSRILNKDRFPENRHIFLLDLLEKFNLCYGIRGKEDVYYIPDLFEDIEPDFDWDSDDALRFRYDYDDFPPDAFMTRFIVEMHEDIKDDTRWRSGVLISNGTCQAKVFQTFRKNYIEIEVLGNKAECPRYLYAIRDTFRRLHKPFPEMTIKQQIMYKKYWLNYPQLVKLEDRNKPFHHIDLGEDLPIERILNSYSTLIERQIEILGRIEKKVNKINSQTLLTHSLLGYLATENTRIKYPNIFSLKPARQSINDQSNLYSLYNLQLYCSHLGCFHPVGDAFTVKILKEWVKKLAPYYNRLVKGLQAAAPAIRPAAYQLLGPAAYAPNNLSLKGTQDYIGKLKEIGEGPKSRSYEPRTATEAEMQIIKQIIDQADPNKEWMRYLQKVVADDKVIWVCEQHAEEY